MANDTLVFRVDEDKTKYPSVSVNDLPVPDEVLQYVLSEQQKGIKDGKTSNIITRTSINGKQKRVILTSKETKH